MLTCSRPRRIIVWLAILAGLAAAPARAGDTGAGSKNFSVPNSVPNYFSNEVGPMVGGAAETRRGELYQSQAVSSAQATASIPAAPSPRYRQHVAMVVPHGRDLRGRHRAPEFGHHLAARGRAPSHVVAVHRGERAYAAHAVSRASHPASRTTRVSSTHRARG